MQRRGVLLGGNWLFNHAWYSYLLGRLEGETGDFATGLDRCEFARREQQELRDADGGLGKENPLVASSSAWVGETMSRFQFLTGKIDREQLLAQQRQILADRKALSKRGLKGGNYAGQYESEVGASAAVLAGYLIEAGKAEEALAIVEDVLPAQQRLVENDKQDNQEVPGYDLRVYLFRQVWAELLARQRRGLGPNRQAGGCQQGRPSGRRDHRGSLPARALLSLRLGPSPDVRLNLARRRRTSAGRPCREGARGLHRRGFRQPLQAAHPTHGWSRCVAERISRNWSATWRPP